MATKYAGVPCYDKADRDEELFVLRAKDASSPAVVVEWIRQNIHTAPPEKLHEALDTAIRMRSYVGRKQAD